MKIATCDTREPHLNLDSFTVNAARLTMHWSHTLIKIATHDTREPHVNLDSFTVNAAH